MATAPADKSLTATATAQVSEPMSFGAYGNAANDLNKTIGLTPGAQHANENIPGDIANDNPPAAKVNGSLDFVQSDKRWLKELGITTTHPIDFQNTWATGADRERQKTLPWKETYRGRMAIRTISRGVVGTMFYAAAQMYAGNALKQYKLNSDYKPQNVLEHIARIIDKTVGKGIQGAVKLGGGSDETALRAVLFRDTVNFGNKLGDKIVTGRSLGHEAVAVTFDFATMGFTDYMTRYFIGLFDPNSHNAWIKDGHLQPTGALKDLFYNVFRGITYAAGEDMAVAMPYVYFMRAQRKVINKFSPGFKYDSDYGLNGGSFKLNDKNEVVGNYQLEGMLDLMGRFSWYNVGTKMFRDAYNAGENKIAEWWSNNPNDHHPVKPKEHHTVAQNAARSVRYVFRTTIKTMMYMIPSTFFFYVTRSPQTKFRGIAIHPEKGVLGRFTSQDLGSAEDNTNLTNRLGDSRARWQPVRPTSDTAAEKANFTKHTDKQASEGKPRDPDYKIIYRDRPNEEVANPFTGKAADAFSDKFYNGKDGRTPPWHDNFTNPLGRASFSTGTVVNFLLKPFNKVFGLNPKKTETFARTYANASWSYTPYFMMKTDILSAALDTKRMDMAVDRTLHGAAHFNWGEFKAGAGEVLHTVLYEPFSDPMREEKAQEKMLGDPEKRSNEAFQSASLNNNGEGGDKAVSARKRENAKYASTRPTHGTLRKREETWAEWTKPDALEKVKQQEAKPFTQSVAPRPASWTATYNQQQETVPLGQTVH